MSQKADATARTAAQIASSRLAQNLEIKRFTIKALALTLIWMILAEVVIRLLGLSTPLLAYIVIFYSGTLTALIHRMLVKSNDKRPAIFVNMVLGLIGGKMLLSLTLLVIFAFLSSKEGARIILISFIPVYFGNTGTQIFSIIQFMDREKARKKQEELDAQGNHSQKDTDSST